MVIKRGESMLAEDILNLTFFPEGTILTFSSTAWNSTGPAFKAIWKICNKTNHDANPAIPDLTDKFLRGAESSDFITPGGADSVTVPVPLPKHHHKHTHDTHIGRLWTPSPGNNFGGGNLTGDGVFSRANLSQYGTQSKDGYNTGGVTMNAPHSYDETPAGVDEPAVTVNTVPLHYTVIYIIKVA